MRFFSFIILLLALISCQPSPTDMLCKQAWKFDGFDISTELEEKLDSNLNESARKKLRDLLKNGLSKTETILRFYQDGSCAQLDGDSYRTGRWQMGGKTELLTIEYGDSRDVYRIESRDKELVLWRLGSKGNETGQIAATLHPSEEFQNGDMDLLSPDRNTWRNKPAQPEMFRQIKKRLADQLTYMTDYFEMVEKKEQGYFSIAHLNSPFRFYSGGIGLFNFDELPVKWKEQFYNDGDALIAHVLLSSAFGGEIPFPSGRKSHTEAFARFLKQVKVFIMAQEEPESLPVQ